MPGKTDYAKALSVPKPTGNYGFSKEVKAWDEGYRERYRANGTAGNNPHPAGSKLNSAWADGWSTADANSSGFRFMPAIAQGATPPA